MMIKSPMQEQKVRPNTRKKTKNRENGHLKEVFHSNGDGYGKRIQPKKEKKKSISIPKLKPWKVILGAMVLGALGILYLNHVFATQKLLREVQQLEGEYNQAKRIHSSYRLKYDRMIGPSEIYDKAKNLGFINGGPAEKVIEVQK